MVKVLRKQTKEFRLLKELAALVEEEPAAVKVIPIEVKVGRYNEGVDRINK
jgi:hypothetical protein